MAAEESIAVFGGSGNTGQEVIGVALRKGLRVRALYRPGSEPTSVASGLEVISGQLRETAAVRRTLEGTSGAVLVFGPRLGRGRNPEPFCASATATIVAEMKALGIERLVCQTGAMAGGDTPNWSRAVRRFVRRNRRRYPAIDAERDRQEAAVKSSGLDWTVAKPFRISRARGKGHVRAAPAIRISVFTSVRRADLAEFHVDELTDRRFHHQAVYVVT